MLKGHSEFISIFLVLQEKGVGEIMGRQPLSSFPPWWKNSQYPTEMVPSVGSPEAALTYSWMCWARQCHTGQESYRTSQMLRIAVSGFPTLLFNLWHPV